MAVKLKRLPKKPKAGASEATLKRWIMKANEINKQNKALIAEERRKNALLKKISAMTKKY